MFTIYPERYVERCIVLRERKAAAEELGRFELDAVWGES